MLLRVKFEVDNSNCSYPYYGRQIIPNKKAAIAAFLNSVIFFMYYFISNIFIVLTDVLCSLTEVIE
jgi:hypothetical protein